MRHFRRLLWTFFLCLTACLGNLRGMGELLGTAPLVRNFTREEIGASRWAAALLEVPDGTLFAGADRLFIFNGVNWTYADSINTPYISSLCWDGARLWAGGQNEIGFFERTSAGDYKYNSVTSRLGEKFFGTVTQLVCHGDRIVGKTENKVFSLPLDGSTATSWDMSNEKNLRLFLLDDTVYVIQRFTDTAKTWILKDGEMAADLSSSSPLARVMTPVGLIGRNLVYGFDTNIYLRNLDTREERCLHDDRDGLLKSLKPQAGYICRGEYIYINTAFGGLVRIGLDGQMKKIGKAEGLKSNSCGMGICHSQYGGLWVSTEDGISFIQDATVAAWLPLPESSYSVISTPEALFVSTLLKTYRYTSVSTEETPLGRLYLSQRGDSFFGASSDTLYKGTWHPLAVDKWLNLGGSSATYLYGANPASNAIYALSTSTGLTRIDLPLGTKVQVDVPEIPHSIVQDKSGSLWLSTKAGNIMKYDERLQKGIIQVSGKIPVDLTLYDDQPILLYPRTGFVSLSGAKVQDSEGFSPVDAINSTNGPAWIRGRIVDKLRFGIITKDATGLRLERKNLPLHPSVKSITTASLSGTDLWLGSTNGVLRVDTTKLEGPKLDLPTPKEIVVTNPEKATHRTLSVNSNALSLKHGESELTVRLPTRFWGLLEPPEYESRLLPLEEEWKRHNYGDPITRKKLSTGRYTLQLRVNHLDLNGPVTELRVWCKPPWYLSPYALALWVVLTVAGFIAAVQIRTRHIAARNRELEAKIKERTAELAKANAAKSEFLAAMSHEIRNPMNGVIGITKILQEAKLGAREKFYLTTLQRCAEQLRTTVDDVLDLAKIEAGEITLHMDTFDLAETITSTITAVDFTGKNIELTSWAGVRPVVKGDKAKFSQILTNYFTNALKYGVPNQATVDVFVLTEGGKHCRVTVAVKNTGPDIPPLELAKLFDSFTRGEDAKKRRINGTGLGLSICKRFADAMGGTVGATSSDGVTVFQVTIPYEIAATREITAEESAGPRPLNARALAIEDEDYNRIVLGNILAKLGYRVDWACDGAQALQLAEMNGYDLILTDWMLPDTDGGTLTKKILAICDEPKPPVFAVSAYSTKDKEAECIEAGMAGFISKPITIEKLEAALQSWAARRTGRPKLMIGQPPTSTAITLEQLERLGPVETMVPEFILKVQTEWAQVDHLLEDRQCVAAADLAHRLISAVLLVGAGELCDLLRALENNLRDGGLDSEIERLRERCRTECGHTTDALRRLFERRQKINEARRWS